MEAKNLAQRLEAIDRQLAKDKLQVTARPFEAHRIIMAEDGIEVAPFFSRGGAPTLFEEINDWYMARYGERMLVDMKIGEKPFILRGVVYCFNFPLAYGTVQFDPLRLVDGLTNDMRRSLSPEEVQLIGCACMEGYYEFLKLDRLRQYPPSGLNADALQMSTKGLQDISAAVSILKDSHDVQGAMFHSQQAAEKFLKAALLQNGYTLRQLRSRDFSHDLQACLTALIAERGVFQDLSRAVADVDVSMNIRYEDLGHTDIDAVRSIHAAVYIASFIGNQWWLEEMRRGQLPALVPGRFYQDGMGMNYKCIDVRTDPMKGDIATVALLDHAGFDIVGTRGIKFASYCYEITDAKEIARLEHRYQTVIARNGKAA
jgi:hypothetical protein